MELVTVMSYAKAVGLALGEAMEQDDRVICFGEDVAFGGGFGATSDLVERFGAARVRNTPISELAIAGLAVGAAVVGMRPVPEIMFFDFSAYAMDQIVNQAAKMRYMFGGKATLPIVFRCASGGWLNSAAQHSQSLEAWFTHVPGLKVATAATPADIRNLLLAAIQDDNPVIVQEHYSLYEETGEVPDSPEHWVLGQARTKREGSDVTIVTWGACVPRVLAAANALADGGIEAEVIDLISLFPWDQATVLASVEKTHRAVIVHQATTRGGYGGEIAATIMERGFDSLDAPILRVGARNTPVPFSPPLENFVLPAAERIVDAVKALS